MLSIFQTLSQGICKYRLISLIVIKCLLICQVLCLVFWVILLNPIAADCGSLYYYTHFIDEIYTLLMHLKLRLHTWIPRLIPKAGKELCYLFWNWLFWYQAESAEFSSVSCFQEGFALGAPMSVATANLSFWKETLLGLKGCFEQFLEFRGEMFKMPGRNNKWSLFSHRLIRCGCAWWLGFEKACERRMEEGRGDFQWGETGRKNGCVWAILLGSGIHCMIQILSLVSP